MENANGQAPTVPVWRGEAPARTEELSAQVADLLLLFSRWDIFELHDDVDRGAGISPVQVLGYFLPTAESQADTQQNEEHQQ